MCNTVNSEHLIDLDCENHLQLLLEEDSIEDRTQSLRLVIVTRLLAGIERKKTQPLIDILYHISNNNAGDCSRE